MPESSPPPATGGARCPECGFLNAPASLYCQDCGAKLAVAPPSYLSAPPPAVPTEAGPTAPAAVSGTRKPRILSTNRERPAIGIFFGVTFRVLIYAAVTAALIQLFRAPRDLPPPVPAIDATVIEQVRAKFSESAQRGIPVDAPWARTNAYLAGVLVPAGDNAAAFVRAIALYRDNGFALVTEKRVAGRLSIYTTIQYEIVARGSGLSLHPTGGAIGRLPLPGWASPLLSLVGGDVGPALKFELDLMSNARSVQFTPASARVDFAAPQP